MPFGVRPDPSVTINLEEPDTTNTFLNVYKLAVPGNLATVKVSIKKDDAASSWDHTGILPVDTATGEVSLPISWFTDEDDMIPVGQIEIVPLTSWDDRAEDFLFKVDIQGCYCKPSEYSIFL